MFTPSPNVILLVLMLTMGSLAYVFGRMERGTRAAVGWGASIILLGIGYGLLQWQGRTQNIPSVLSEIIILASVAVMHDALQRWDTRPNINLRIACWSMVAIASILLVCFTFIAPSARVRIIIFSGAIAFIMGWGAVKALRLPREINAVARRIFSVVIWAAAAIFLSRMVGTLAAGPHDDGHFRFDFLHPLVTSLSVLLVTILTVSLLWMEVSMLNAQVASLISHDVLTGLPNSRAIREACERELARAERYSEPVAIALVEIDHLQNLRDSHGDAMADDVLKHGAGLLLHQARKPDMAGRFDEERFMIVMPQTGTHGGATAMERLRKRIEANPFQRGSLRLPLSVSAGVAEAASHITGVEALTGAAERALYRAIRDGRNRVATAAAELRPEVSAIAGAAAVSEDRRERTPATPDVPGRSANAKSASRQERRARLIRESIGLR